VSITWFIIGFFFVYSKNGAANLIQIFVDYTVQKPVKPEHMRADEAAVFDEDLVKKYPRHSRMPGIQVRS